MSLISVHGFCKVHCRTAWCGTLLSIDNHGFILNRWNDEMEWRFTWRHSSAGVWDVEAAS